MQNEPNLFNAFQSVELDRFYYKNLDILLSRDFCSNYVIQPQDFDCLNASCWRASSGEFTISLFDDENFKSFTRKQFNDAPYTPVQLRNALIDILFKYLKSNQSSAYSIYTLGKENDGAKSLVIDIADRERLCREYLGVNAEATRVQECVKSSSGEVDKYKSEKLQKDAKNKEYQLKRNFLLFLSIYINMIFWIHRRKSNNNKNPHLDPRSFMETLLKIMKRSMIFSI